MAIVLVCFLVLLVGAMVAEFGFRAGQVGIAILAVIFGPRYFRPEEVPRIPFYGCAGIVSVVAMVSIGSILAFLRHVF